MSLSVCARWAVRSDDRTHISSCRTPITPATYRCTIKITNGRFGCRVEVCNEGFIKQQERQRWGHSTAKFKILQPENIPWKQSTSRGRGQASARRPATPYPNTHRWSAMLENNNWPWSALDIVPAAHLWCKCFSCVWGRSASGQSITTGCIIHVRRATCPPQASAKCCKLHLNVLQTFSSALWILFNGFAEMSSARSKRPEPSRESMSVRSWVLDWVNKHE